MAQTSTPSRRPAQGLLCLSGNNTYTGTTYVNAGTLQIGNGGAGKGLASSCLSVSSGAVLAFNNADTLTISPSAGVVNNGLVAMNGGGTATISPTAGISGNGGVVIPGKTAPACRKIGVPYGVAGVEDAGQRRSGYSGGFPRAPLAPLGSKARKAVAEALHEARAGLEY